MNRIDRLTGTILLLQGDLIITAEQIATHFGLSVHTVYLMVDESLRSSLHAALLKVRSVLPREQHDALSQLKQTVRIGIDSPRKRAGEVAVGIQSLSATCLEPEDCFPQHNTIIVHRLGVSEESERGR